MFKLILAIIALIIGAAIVFGLLVLLFGILELIRRIGRYIFISVIGLTAGLFAFVLADELSAAFLPTLEDQYLPLAAATLAFCAAALIARNSLPPEHVPDLDPPEILFPSLYPFEPLRPQGFFFKTGPQLIDRLDHNTERLRAVHKQAANRIETARDVVRAFLTAGFIGVSNERAALESRIKIWLEKAESDLADHADCWPIRFEFEALVESLQRLAAAIEYETSRDTQDHATLGDIQHKKIRGEI